MKIPYRLALIPLAIAGILITTAVPLELGAEAGWNLAVSPADVVQNLLLYLPLGVALWRYPLWRTALWAGLLSLGIEFTQRWGVDRFASTADVVANTVGAVAAAWCCQQLSASRGIQRDQLRITVPRLLLATVVATTIVALWSRPVAPVVLDSWNPDYPLLVGNERTPDRPWRGTLNRLDLETATSAIRLYTPIELGGNPAITLAAEQSADWTRAAINADSFAIAAAIRTESLEQYGPARIVSLSWDTLHRNVDLGQDGRRLVFRMRSEFGGVNGERGRLESPPFLELDSVYQVIGSFDGYIARLIVNDRLVSRRNIAAQQCAIPALCDWAVPAAWSVVGGVAALVALAIVPAASATTIVLLCLAAAGLPLLYLSTVPAVAFLSGPHGWLPLLAPAGGLVVAIARLMVDPQTENQGDPAAR